jgi:hypothetical protein
LEIGASPRFPPRGRSHRPPGATTAAPPSLTPSRSHYPRETVGAEKFEAVVQLGMTNSRMKDYYDLMKEYYDLWFMSRHFEFGGSTRLSNSNI